MIKKKNLFDKKKKVSIPAKEGKKEFKKIELAGGRAVERKYVVDYMGVDALFDTYMSFRKGGHAPRRAYNEALNWAIPLIRKTKRENFGNRY